MENKEQSRRQMTKIERQNIFMSSDDNSSDSAYDEKISFLNGTIRKNRKYKNVHHSIFEEQNKQNTEKLISEVEFFADIKDYCIIWKYYEKEKKSYIKDVISNLDSACYGHDDAKKEIQRILDI